MPEAGSERDRVLAELQEQLREKTNLRFAISCSEYGELPRSQLKAKRFRDLRSKGGE
jgi:phenylacetate-CoA ligase